MKDDKKVVEREGKELCNGVTIVNTGSVSLKNPKGFLVHNTSGVVASPTKKELRKIRDVIVTADIDRVFKKRLLEGVDDVIKGRYTER